MPTDTATTTAESELSTSTLFGLCFGQYVHALYVCAAPSTSSHAPVTYEYITIPLMSFAIGFPLTFIAILCTLQRYTAAKEQQRSNECAVTTALPVSTSRLLQAPPLPQIHVTANSSAVHTHNSRRYTINTEFRESPLMLDMIPQRDNGAARLFAPVDTTNWCGALFV
jgi:hypothetical protein